MKKFISKNLLAIRIFLAILFLIGPFVNLYSHFSATLYIVSFLCLIASFFLPENKNNKKTK